MAKPKRTFTSRWFRVYDEVVDDPKIQQLGDKLTVFWLNCMCLASKNDGYLPPVADIAWKLRKPEAVISSMIATLYERGLLDQQGDTFSPHNWEQRQYISDSSTERVRRYRERMKRPSNKDETFPKRDETVSVTPSDTETETETENTPNPHAPSGALSVVKPRPSRKGKRTTDELRKALGVRLPWWEEFWRVYPEHDGMREAMDAFERIVTTRELAVEVYNGAKRYAAKCAATPDVRIKYGQGWLNGERWKDEGTMIAPRPTGISKWRVEEPPQHSPDEVAEALRAIAADPAEPDDVRMQCRERLAAMEARA